MVTKLADVHSNVSTEKNVFYSAYLKGKVQYNDVDPDKVLKIEDEKKDDYSAVPGVELATIKVEEKIEEEEKVEKVEKVEEEESGKIIVTIHNISNPSSSDNLEKLEQKEESSQEEEESEEEESEEEESSEEDSV
jgi:hypothetical protein